MLEIGITKHIKKEDEKFFKTTQIAYIFAIVVHIILVFIFNYLQIVEMVLVNVIFSIPIFICAYFLNRKGYLNIAFTIISIEFVIHQVFTIYYIGWESGFQYYLICLSILVFFNHNWKRITQLSISTFVFFIFISIYLVFKEEHLYTLPPNVYESLYLFGIIGTVTVIIILVNFFVKTASRSESELELLVCERTSELMQSQKDAIFMLGEAGHFNDNDTGVHIWRMADYSALLASKIGLPEKEVELIRLAAPMHDSGKIGIPDKILKKPAKLNEEEWKIMQTHCQLGYDILKQSNTTLFKLAASIALHHHERYDGSGYPKQLKGEEIPLAARIVSICDVFDALTMKRPYKEAWSIEDAIIEIKSNSGLHFDPNLVDVFINIKDELVEIKNYWDKNKN